jgi:ribose transport system ATP-binding protein
LVELSGIGDRKPALAVRNLTKTFAGMTALSDFTLAVYPGQIHGLIGQNGSGKSTFIKCLAGYHRPDSSWSLEVGDISLSRPLRPGEVTGYGISFVHQDLGLLPELSVLENLMLVQFANDHRRFLPWRRERNRYRQLLEGFGLDIDLHAPISSLAPVEAAQIAIVRAVAQMGRASEAGSGHAGVLVLDEATTFLDQAGRQSMASLLRSLKTRGLAVIFVSHDLEEVLAICDRVTVLRDGKEVLSSSVDQVTHAQLVSMITGGVDDTTTPVSPRRPLPSQAEISLKVDNLSSELVEQVSFEAARGTITALTGIVGAGWESVLPLIYGARPATSGQLILDDRVIPAARLTPRRSISLGIVYVPANRLTEAVIAELSLEENLTLPQLSRHVRKGFLRHAMLRATSQALVEEFTVKTTSVAAPIGALSGGNQQKAVLGKWFAQEPSIILLAEPTQGVDVGARQKIYEIIRGAAARGATVLYASSDWGEVVELADKVVIFTNGRVSSTLTSEDLSVDTIARESYRGSKSSFSLDVGADILEFTLTGASSADPKGAL